MAASGLEPRTLHYSKFQWSCGSSQEVAEYFQQPRYRWAKYRTPKCSNRPLPLIQGVPWLHPPAAGMGSSTLPREKRTTDWWDADNLFRHNIMTTRQVSRRCFGQQINSFHLKLIWLSRFSFMQVMLIRWNLNNLGLFELLKDVSPAI